MEMNDVKDAIRSHDTLMCMESWTLKLDLDELAPPASLFSSLDPKDLQIGQSRFFSSDRHPICQTC
jgi:hypothetical protein